MIFQKPIIRVIAGLGIITSCLTSTMEPGVAAGQQLRLTYDYYGGAESRGKFYLPIPPETSCQQIISFHSSWTGSEFTTGPCPAQRWLTGTTPERGRMHWRVRIVGVFTHEPDPGANPPNGSFLETSDALDWKSANFQAWLDDRDLRRKPEESATTFARRVFDFLTAHGDYTYPPAGGWTASGAARRLRTDCGGFSLVFVAACRASHIPARLLVGQWLKTNGDAVIGRQAHVIAEFYDATTGWVPVDVYAGLTHRSEGDNFGRLPGYFFTWHFDTDYHFDVPAGADGHVQWIQNPAPWFAGDSGADGSHRWRIEPAP